MDSLRAVDVVSHWTWSITLLQSSTVAWNYGISGPFWCVSYLLHSKEAKKYRLPVDTCFGQAEKYLSARVSTCHQQSIDKRKSIDLQLDCSSRRYSAGAVLQIMLFGIMAIQIKRKAPNCHTILEVVRLRWGKAAHLVGTLFPPQKTLTSLPSLLPSTHSSHSLWIKLCS